jgi:hypothetical protein
VGGEGRGDGKAEGHGPRASGMRGAGGRQRRRITCRDERTKMKKKGV